MKDSHVKGGAVNKAGRIPDCAWHVSAVKGERSKYVLTSYEPNQELMDSLIESVMEIYRRVRIAVMLVLHVQTENQLVSKTYLESEHHLSSA